MTIFLVALGIFIVANIIIYRKNKKEDE